MYKTFRGKILTLIIIQKVTFYIANLVMPVCSKSTVSVPPVQNSILFWRKVTNSQSNTELSLF